MISTTTSSSSSVKPATGRRTRVSLGLMEMPPKRLWYFEFPAQNAAATPNSRFHDERRARPLSWHPAPEFADGDAPLARRRPRSGTGSLEVAGAGKVAQRIARIGDGRPAREHVHRNRLVTLAL